jgi:hypothetical protein
MKRYEPATPRPAIAALAVALTAATIGLMVVAPAMQAGGGDTLLAARRAPAATTVTIHPSSIDVVAVREATAPARPVADAGAVARPRG